MANDPGLETLLDLHGEVIDQEDGFWVKLEAWRTPPSASIPHGIRYCLTLHEPGGKRILGYDNAHAVKPVRGFRFSGQVLTFDHRHRHGTDRGVPYAFSNAAQWLSDFFSEVDRVLKEFKR